MKSDCTFLVIGEIENVLADLAESSEAANPHVQASAILDYLVAHDLAIVKQSECKQEIQEAYEEVERARNEAETWKRVSYQSERRARQKECDAIVKKLQDVDEYRKHRR